MKIAPLLLLVPTLLIGCASPDEGAKSPGPVATHYELVTDWPQLPDSLVLGDPTGLGLDDAGDLWVFCRGARAWTEPFPTDPIATNTVLRLDRASGQLIGSWGADRFIMPHGLTVDRKGNLWLTDVGLHQVFCFTSDGELLLELGEARVPGNDSAHFNLPTDVAVAADGSFYVADGYGNSRVVKFDSAGHYLFAWGTKGTEPGQFDTPHAIDLDSAGNVYVADRENHRVQVFTADGTFLRRFNVPDRAAVYAVCIDRASQTMVMVDYLKEDTTIRGSTVRVADSSGNTGLHFGRTGHYDGPVCRYHDVCVDADGSIYVGDILGDRLQKFVRKSK